MISIAAHPTVYDGIQFRSRLEARWAAFFDLIEWKYKYEPIDFADWTPDFYIEFECGHSECNGSHRFYAEVKPYQSIGDFDGHPASKDFYGDRYGLDGSICLGLTPEVARAEFCHGAGGGVWEGLDLFQDWSKNHDVELAWSGAGNLVQWKGVKSC